MEKRKSQYITIPVSIWSHGDLSLQEKAVLIEIDSMCGDDGTYTKPISRLGTHLRLPKHTVNQIVTSLIDKGAVTLKMDDSGNNIITPDLTCRRYLPKGTVEGITPEQNVDRIDYDMLLAEWKRTNPDLQQPKAFTPKMQQQVRTLLRNNKSSIDELINVFEAVACSEFLNGRVGNRGWKASLHWVIKDSNNSYQRILNGDFHHSEEERAALDRIFSPEDDNDNDNYFR